MSALAQRISCASSSASLQRLDTATMTSTNEHGNRPGPVFTKYVQCRGQTCFDNVCSDLALLAMLTWWAMEQHADLRMSSHSARRYIILPCLRTLDFFLLFVVLFPPVARCLFLLAFACCSFRGLSCFAASASTSFFGRIQRPSRNLTCEKQNCETFTSSRHASCQIPHSSHLFAVSSRSQCTLSPKSVDAVVG